MIKLDHRPRRWEAHTSLYCAFLIESGVKSTTVKSYVSAIKFTVVSAKYMWKDEEVLLNTLTRSCCLINDRVKTRLPIYFKLLELILFEVDRTFRTMNQPYLKFLYITILLVGYYGLFRIGELTTGDHPMKAKDIPIGQNKDKILIILYTSKTHSKESRPQEIKITARSSSEKQHVAVAKQFFCPFAYMQKYIKLRGNYKSADEPFFVLRDCSPV